MKLAAIDIGLKRIGVAYSPDGNVVFPQDAILRKNRNQASHDVDAFLQTYAIDHLIVGIPQEGESAEEMGRRIRHFVGLLEFKGKISYENEYGSSQEAKDLSKGVFRQRRDGKIDSLSAQIILERWIRRNSPQ